MWHSHPHHSTFSYMMLFALHLHTHRAHTHLYLNKQHYLSKTDEMWKERINLWWTSIDAKIYIFFAQNSLSKYLFSELWAESAEHIQSNAAFSVGPKEEEKEQITRIVTKLAYQQREEYAASMSRPSVSLWNNESPPVAWKKKLEDTDRLTDS